MEPSIGDGTALYNYVQKQHSSELPSRRSRSTTCGLADRFLSEIRVVANLFSNVFAIAVVARW
jgi:hypothetical protein